MIGVHIFALVVWLIAGIITILSPYVTKLEYGLCWFILLINLVGNLADAL